MRILAIFMLPCLLMAGCVGMHGDRKRPSWGGAHDITVVCDPQVWDGALGDTLRGILRPASGRTPFEVLHIRPGAFSRHMAESRNLLMVRIGESYAEPFVDADTGHYALGQTVVVFSSPTVDSLVPYVAARRNGLYDLFASQHEEQPAPAQSGYLGKRIKKKFGLTIDLPCGYALRGEGVDYIWVSANEPQADRGIVLYGFTYMGREDLYPRSMVRRRTAVGMRTGAPCMGTLSDSLSPVHISHMDINGRRWVRMDGLCPAAHAATQDRFFVCTSRDTLTGRALAVDFYVRTDGKQGQRHSREMEAIACSMRTGE